jgi:hypothetical protein
MQYKQVPRIALEIHDTPDTPLKVRLAALQLLGRRRKPPKLGPYRKRSPEQALWRMASNSQLGGAERWKALRKLIRRRRVVTATDGGTSPVSEESTTGTASVTS